MWILGSMAIVSQIISPLITRVNSPMVTRTKGRDRAVTTGLTMALIAEKTKPASRKVATDIGIEFNVS